MANKTLSLEEIDRRIAIVRDNLRQLVEQAAAQSGASDDDRVSQRIANYEAELTQLKEQREELTRGKKR
jgi:CYTH domain-containing protein